MVSINNIHQGKSNSHFDPTAKIFSAMVHHQIAKVSIKTFHCNSGCAHCTAILNFF